MTGHDPLCRAQHMAVETDIDDLDGCDCALIARVRADERERIFSGVRWRRSVGDKSWSIECLTDRDAECPGCLCDCHVEAEVRERMRAQVEALPHGHDKDGTVCMIGYGAGCTCWKRDVLALLGGESGG